MPKEVLEWEALESFLAPRSGDWFWAVGIIGLALAVAAMIFNNFLFGVFILLAAVAIMLRSVRPPRKIHVRITSQGVRINSELFPFSQLTSFWVEDEAEEDWLVLHTKKTVVSYVKVPIFDVDPEYVRQFLLDYLEEERRDPHLAEGIGDYLGF